MAEKKVKKSKEQRTESKGFGEKGGKLRAKGKERNDSSSKKVRDSKKAARKSAVNKETQSKSPAKAVSKERVSKKAPQTMDELLAQTGYTLRGVKRGQTVEGTVTDISKKMVLIDIGGKTEGLVVDKEFDAARDFVSSLSVGDTVKVYVLNPENDRGQTLLSLRKAAVERLWEKFEEAVKTGEIITVRGVETNRGGVIVRVDSLQGFVPSSQFGKQWLGKLEELVERSFQVRVIEVDREKNRLIFSEREVSEAEEIKQRSKALARIKVGEVYDGVVSGVMPFGVFVSVEVPLEGSAAKPNGEKKAVGKVEGLVHISEISWEKVENPGNHFRMGDTVKVLVLGIDTASGKLNLSVKRLLADPWEEIEKKFPVGQKFVGKVSRVALFGAFVTLGPGIEGLLHISKIPAGKEPEVGKPIEVYIEEINTESRRVSLGMVLKEVPVGYK